MKAVLIVVCVLFVTHVFSQEKYLSILNTETGKEVVFKENKRVRVRTVQGGKLNGKLRFADENQVMINNVIIPITSIEKIKKNPMVLQVFITGSLAYIGVIGVGGGLILMLGYQEIPIGLSAFVIGSTAITGGILAPNILPATRIYKNTKIKVLTLE